MHAGTTARRPATSHRGWLALALLLLWSQFAAALHVHAPDADSSPHRGWNCELCIAHAAAAAPPPVPPLLVAPAATRAVFAAAAAQVPVLVAWHRPQSPRAPPDFHHA